MQEAEGLYSLHYSFSGSTTKTQFNCFLRQGNREAPIPESPPPGGSSLPFPQPLPISGSIPARSAPTSRQLTGKSKG